MTNFKHPFFFVIIRLKKIKYYMYCIERLTKQVNTIIMLAC